MGPQKPNAEQLPPSAISIETPIARRYPSPLPSAPNSRHAAVITSPTPVQRMGFFNHQPLVIQQPSGIGIEKINLVSEPTAEKGQPAPIQVVKTPSPGVTQEASPTNTKTKPHRPRYSQRRSILGSLFVDDSEATVPPTATTQPQDPLQFFGIAFGDCAESVPLSVVANLAMMTGKGELRLASLSTDVVRFIPSIPNTGPPGFPVHFKIPCENCIALMKAIPSTATILACSGTSQDVEWIVGNMTTPVWNVDEIRVREFSQLPWARTTFPLSDAYAAPPTKIYEILEKSTVLNSGSSLSPDHHLTLKALWNHFIVPFRDQGDIFRLKPSGDVNPYFIMLNNVRVPLHTIFCALAYILSVVLEPLQARAQERLFYVPLMAVLAKWCRTLCPWGYPAVVSVSYTTSKSEISTRFFLGTSKPIVRVEVGNEYFQAKHLAQMRNDRKQLLIGAFGELPGLSTTRITTSGGS